jgi:ribosomal protein L11 methyltransferase
MRSILFRNDPDQEDSLMADLWEIGTAGIAEESGGWRVFFDGSVDINPLLRRYRSLAVETREEQSRDWQLVSREGWDPVLAGERFFIVPPWLSDAAPPGRTRLVIDTGMAFGSGRHESTQLMIEALETYLAPGQSVFDIGCGSGILSAVSEALGAGCVLACDVDFESVRRSPLHTRAPAFVGSAAAVQSGRFDIVAVNISAAVIDSLAADLHRVVKPGGILLLAGFIEQNPPRHFQADEILQRNDWQCWVCRISAAR